MANMLYNEHYNTAKMDHSILHTEEKLTVEYTWQKRGQHKNRISVIASPDLHEIAVGSEEEFIFEHYYGYNQLSVSKIIEYAVHHPRWQTYIVKDYFIDCSIEKLWKRVCSFSCRLQTSICISCKGIYCKSG